MYLHNFRREPLPITSFISCISYLLTFCPIASKLLHLQIAFICFYVFRIKYDLIYLFFSFCIAVASLFERHYTSIPFSFLIEDLLFYFMSYFFFRFLFTIHRHPSNGTVACDYDDYSEKKRKIIKLWNRKNKSKSRRNHNTYFFFLFYNNLTLFSHVYFDWMAGYQKIRSAVCICIRDRMEKVYLAVCS